MISRLVLAALLTPHAAAAPVRDFTLESPVSPETPEGQRAIAARALTICAGKYPHLGRYRFSGTEMRGNSADSRAAFTIHQELTCLDAPPPPLAQVGAAPPDWQPSESDVTQVMRATERYFSLVDGGDAAAVQAMWTPANQAMTPLPRRAAALSAFRDQAGAPLRHRIVKLTWYVNPPSAPEPGIYVAADYERAYSLLWLNCGYLVWLRDASGGYALVREETGSLSREAAPDLTPEIEAQARAALGCAAR